VILIRGAGYTLGNDFGKDISGINLAITVGNKGVASTTGRGDPGRVMIFQAPGLDRRFDARAIGDSFQLPNWSTSRGTPPGLTGRNPPAGMARKSSR
jgi:hypothetical protein